MFDSEKLILEVQIRPCIWNISEKSYSDRLAKRNAWEQIAQEFNNSWSSYTTKKKNETIDDLTKKWKHLRDYYVREKKKQNLKSGSAASKKRITPYFEMLSFLDVSLESRDTEGNFELPEELSNLSDNSSTPPPPTGTPLPPASTSPRLSASERKRMTPFQKSLLQRMTPVDKTADDPDKNFVLSILPDMKSMTEREKFEFKFEIMSAIKRIKYNDVSEYTPMPSTRPNNTYEYRPTSTASTSNSSNTHGYTTRRQSYNIDSPAMSVLSTEDLNEILNIPTSHDDEDDQPSPGIDN